MKNSKSSRKKYKVSFSFTFIGSEGNISKNFIKNNFKKIYLL